MSQQEFEMTKFGQVRRINNPKGYNKHKQDTTPVQEVTREQVQEAYRNLWKAKREQLSKAQIYARLYKQFMGLDKIDEEFKELK